MKKPIVIWLAFVIGVASLIYYLSPNAPIPPVPQAAPRGSRVAAPGHSVNPQSAAKPATAGEPVVPQSTAAPGTPVMTAAPPSPFVSYSELRKALEEKPATVRSLTFIEGTLQVVAVNEAQLSGSITAPTPQALDELRVLAERKQVPLSARVRPEEDKSGSILWTLLLTFGPTLLILWLFLSMLKGARPTARKAPAGRKIEKKKFSDVAGQDGAVKMLKRMLNFDKYAGFFDAFKAKRPKGALLVGPPGVGKTLLIQAMAGEGEYDVHAIAGSDFIEMFVGVGAARVRQIFQELKEAHKQSKRKQIIFIDEFDAVGGLRSGTATSGHNEREQTLNALLVEMDGTEKNDGILVFGATNRLDMLDPAVTRPGRFDYQIHLSLPDLDGRTEILKVHTRGMPLAPDVDHRQLAKKFTGASGAYLAAVANEAAIMAAERAIAQAEKSGVSAGTATPVDGILITRFDFDAARASIEFGDARLSLQKGMTEKQKFSTAVHEVGHAWMAEHHPWGVSVSAVDIIPRAQYLGITVFISDDERVTTNKVEMLNRIKTLMGGRVAQDVLLGECDTGAQNDFQKATVLARKMVAEFGMTELGYLGLPEHASSLGRERGEAVTDIGPKLKDVIDDHWVKIVNSCYAETRAAIERDREQLLAISRAVAERETILGEEWKELVAKYPPVPLTAPSDAAKVESEGAGSPG